MAWLIERPKRENDAVLERGKKLGPGYATCWARDDGLRTYCRYKVV
jgi:hypothetical protein